MHYYMEEASLSLAKMPFDKDPGSDGDLFMISERKTTGSGTLS